MGQTRMDKIPYARIFKKQGKQANVNVIGAVTTYAAVG
jgi:hypothetical protein